MLLIITFLIGEGSGGIEGRKEMKKRLTKPKNKNETKPKTKDLERGRKGQQELILPWRLPRADPMAPLQKYNVS